MYFFCFQHPQAHSSAMSNNASNCSPSQHQTRSTCSENNLQVIQEQQEDNRHLEVCYPITITIRNVLQNLKSTFIQHLVLFTNKSTPFMTQENVNTSQSAALKSIDSYFIK